MLDEHLGFWPFPIFFEYCIRQGTIFPQLINYLLKAFGKTKFQNVPNLYLLYIIEDIYIYISDFLESWCKTQLLFLTISPKNK